MQNPLEARSALAVQRAQAQEGGIPFTDGAMKQLRAGLGIPESTALAVQQAQLDDMPFDVIEAWLLARGWVVVSRDWHRGMVQSLPFGERDARGE